jgi:hypothetical protein
VKFTDTMIRVWVDALTSAPAFRVIAQVRQEGHEWTSELRTYMQAPDEGSLAIDIDVSSLPNFDQPYDVELTYYDAIGTGYRTLRVGYINGQDFRLQEWDDDAKDWTDLV